MDERQHSAGESAAACRFCDRPAAEEAYWRWVRLYPTCPVWTHTLDIHIPRCARCRRKHRLLAAGVIGGYAALVLGAAINAADFAVRELGLVHNDSGVIRWIVLSIVVIVGLALSQLIVPAWKWLMFRHCPEVARLRGDGWGFLDGRPTSR